MDIEGARKLVRDQLANGVSEQEIRDAMSGAGFADEEIEEAFSEPPLELEPESELTYRRPRRPYKTSMTAGIPIGLIFVLVFFFMIAVINLWLAAASYSAMENPEVPRHMKPFFVTIFISSLIFGILYLVSAAGMLLRQGWARTFGIILLIITIIFAVFGPFDIPRAIGFLLYVLALVALFHPSTSDAFD